MENIVNNLNIKDLSEKNQKLEQTILHQSQQIKILTEQLEWFKRQIFGQKSERFVDEPVDSPDLLLFELPEEDEDDSKKIKVPAHEKRKRKKGTFTLELPEDLPHEDIIHDLPESERTCPETGKVMVEFSRETVPKLARREGEYYVKNNIYIKYAVPGEALSGVIQAPAPTCIIEGSKFDVSFMADLVVQKYAYHMPLNRLQESLACNGITVSRQTLSSMIVNLGTKLVPLHDLIVKKLFESGVIFTDDTPVNLLVSGESKAKKARMWLYLAGKPNAPPYHIYHFTTDWKHEHPINFLEKFKGTFHADAYEAYEKLDHDREDITWAACWAHARRKFVEAAGTEKSDFCIKVLRLIKWLFWYERVAWNRSDNARLKIRKEREAPLVEQLHDLLLKTKQTEYLLPKSKLNIAIEYMLSRWDSFTVYLEDADIRMDNNPAERGLRKVCMGKKNWMFFAGTKGGEAAAVLFSLVQTCRAMSINPRKYLEDLFTRFLDHPAKRMDEFLPDQWQRLQDEKEAAATEQ